MTDAEIAGDLLAPFAYDLPRDRIAQVPPARREDARLLVGSRADGSVRLKRITDLPALLLPGDLLVVNESRVEPCRIEARTPGGGVVDLLVLPSASGECARALSRGARLRAGTVLRLPDGAEVRVTKRAGAIATLSGGREALAPALGRHGRAPLPPYIRRARGRDERDPLDRERYQTVYAAGPGSIAAPTAGLHLTLGLLETLRASGVGLARVRLNIGPATFQEIRTENWSSGELGEEAFELSAEAAGSIGRALAEGRRIVAVGTSVCRTLESLPVGWEGSPRSIDGATRIFIRPGHTFRFVGALLTNFHLPQAPPLVLTCAFAGTERLLGWYARALTEGFRFASYGDAMLVE